MGEVYRARDAKLNRDVAIKVLLPSVANDPDRLARFSREAQVLASLNHSNIAQIFGIEESNGVTALVMELVEGEDLSQRIARGPLPIDEALPIARQIAEALEAAHEQGIIHRDLKPANIKVRPDGTVKVLDFGLAKAADPPAGTAAAAALANSPTLTSPAMMTGVGVILGTAAYMSPEQAKGRPADKRSDVWAFGCVLYEMLTGRRAFDGEDMTEVLGAVVRLEPSWDVLSNDVPQPIRALLQSCLIKDRRHRVADISTALYVLKNFQNLGIAANAAATRSPQRSALWRRAVTPVSAALLTAVAVSTLWYASRAEQSASPRVSRLSITPVGNAAVTIVGTNSLGITHDGSRVMYVGNRGTQLFVRALDALDAVPVFTSEVVSMPFASADDQWIGFSSNGILTKVALTGGPASSLTTLDGAGRGATWGPDDTIIFATSNRTTGLQRVGAAGGTTSVLTRPDASQGEGDHIWPHMLPGGRAVLFTIVPVTGGYDAAQVAVLNLETGARTILVRGGSNAAYVSGRVASTRDQSEVGYLVYAAADTLKAVVFDVAHLETRGDPVAAVAPVVRSATGAVQAVVSRDGTLAYIPVGAGAELVERTLVWVDRQGGETAIPAPRHRWVYPRLSPDGLRVAAVAIDEEVDVWIWNFNQNTLGRATLDPGTDHSPVWTSNGRELIFSSERYGIRNLFKQSANTTGAAERLLESANRQNASAVSPDGRRLVFTETMPATGDDVLQLELDGSRRVTPLLNSVFAERNGVISPDGRWIAYESNDSSRFEVFVRPYPDVTSDQWQVSTGGGTRPLWARSGRELMYVAPSGAVMRVGIGRGPSWSTTPPTVVVKEGYLTRPEVDLGVTYDIAIDDKRFLMIKGIQTSSQRTGATSVIVIQNWIQELQRLVRMK